MTAHDVLRKAAGLMEDDDMIGMFSAISEASSDSRLASEASGLLRGHIGIIGSLLAWTRCGIDRADVIAALRGAAGGMQ